MKTIQTDLKVNYARRINAPMRHTIEHVPHCSLAVRPLNNNIHRCINVSINQRKEKIIDQKFNR